MHPPSLHLISFLFRSVLFVQLSCTYTCQHSMHSMTLLTDLLISVWTQEYLFYLGDSYNPALSSFILLLALSQHWPSRVPSSCPYVAASIWFFFFSTSLLFGSTRCLGSSCLFLSPSWNQSLFQGALFLSLENSIWELGVLSARRMLLFLDLISNRTTVDIYLKHHGLIVTPWCQLHTPSSF